MSYRPSERTRGRAALLSPRGIAATIGSLSAAVAFLAAAGSAQAISTSALTAGPRPAVGQAATIPQGAVRLGAEPSRRVLHLDVVLEPRDPAALSRYATQVATPGSPMYHNYLPRGVFPRVFGPTESAIATVRATLSALGLKLGKTSASRLSVPVTGSVATVERAFGTKLATYRLAGRVGFANVSAPRLPAVAAPYVQAVFGLDSLLRMQPLMTKPTSATVGKVVGSSPGPDVKTGGPQPCKSAKSAQASIYAKSSHQAWVLTPDQMAADYEFSPLYRSGDFGRGQTVAIVELGEPNLPSDITAYQRCYGTHAKVSYLNIDHFKQKGAGEGEAALDIETVIAMAPKANVIVYRGPSSNQGWYDTFATVAFDDLAKVESVSYGLCEAIFPHSLASALNVVYEEEAIQGQTVVISSGDTGSEGCLRVEANKPALLSAEFPASDPNVLSVGGTSIVSPKVRARQEEVVWNDHFDQDGAGGGGQSTFWAEPSYQKPSITTENGGRAVPDVSADADPETGYLIAWKGGWLQVGGTSAAAPLWAALLTLTNNKCSGSTIGFVTPLMYYVASKHVKAVVLNDVIARSAFPSNGSNDYTGDGGEYPVLKGYDLATGLGTPIGGALATQLCKFSADSKGYWLATADGQVYNFHAPFHGSLGGKHLASKVVGIADDPHTNGYWLVTAKGAVTGFHAPGRGSAHNPSSPIVGIAASPSGRGYWLVTAKGHVYAFGVTSHGSVSGHLSSPVVGIAADAVTGGYWVVTRGGKVYSFDAASQPAKSLSKVTGIAATPTGQAYWLVTTTGKVYGFGVTAPIGMPIGNRFGAVIGIAGDRATGGYYLATSTGIVGAIDAGVHGSHSLQSGKDPIVGIATTH